MSDQPLITLIVTFYNEEAYLDECLASVSRQDYPHLEILLMDDASTDRSPQIAYKYAKQDGRMQLHRMENNSGIAHLRNYALDIAQGDYIAWVDGDDWIDPHHISTLYDTIRQAPEQPAIALCPTQRHYADGRTKDLRGKQKQHLTVINPAKALVIMIVNDNISSHLWNKLFPRALFEGLCMPEGRVFEDFHIIPKVITRATCLIYTDQTYYHYRLHASSIVHVPSPKNDYDLFSTCRDRILFLRHNPPLLSPKISQMLEVYPLKMMHRVYHRQAQTKGSEAQIYLSKMANLGQDVDFVPHHRVSYSWHMLLLSLRKRYTEWRLRANC